MIWAKTNGISSHQGIESIETELDQTEQLATVTGRPREQIGALNISGKLLATKRLWFSMKENRPRAKKPIGSCKSIGLLTLHLTPKGVQMT